MASTAIHSDVEMFLTDHIKTKLAALAAGPPGPYRALAADVYVGNQFPPARRPRSVVVRDDGGPTTSVVTKRTSVGVTILAGDDATDGQEATQLALLVVAIVAACPGLEDDNPVAAVLSMNGPLKVPDESGQPRRYFTADLALAGKEFAL